MLNLVSALFLLLLCSIIPSQVHSQCDGLKDGFYAHNTQCDKYIECKDGKEVSENLCPDGLVFNPYGSGRLPRCELPFSVDCTDRPELQPAQSSEHCPRKYGMFRVDCARYRQCDNGVPYDGYCPEGLSFSDVYGVCDWSENIEGCDGPKQEVFNCPDFNAAQYSLIGDPRFPDTTDCKKLFVCVAMASNGNYKMVPRHLSCEDGRVYNAKKNECDDPENVPGCEKYYEAEKTVNELN